MQAFDQDDGGAAFSDAFSEEASLRLLVVADNCGPSQAIAFIEGLAGARARGEAAVRILDEAAFGPDLGLGGAGAARALAERQMAAIRPTIVVLSRLGHVAALEGVWAAARARGLAVVMHLDDDLFDLPATIGIERYRGARQPRRIQALFRALRAADLIVAASEALAERLAPMAGHGRIGWLENGTAGTPSPRSRRPAGAPVVVGYMGSASHGPDLALAIPALNALLASRRKVRVELFGSIAKLPVADQLPEVVVRHDNVAGDYRAFRRKLASLEWDIGLAPLVAAPYNRCKTATKWAEYAEAGAAVLAADVDIYRPMIKADAAAGAGPGGWPLALTRLVDQPALRQGLVRAADALLLARFGWDRLESSLIALLDRASALAAVA